MNGPQYTVGGQPPTLTETPTTPPAIDTGGDFVPGTFTGGGQFPLASVMASGLMQPWTTPFVAPTAEQARKDPGFQFSFDEGIKALQRSAAAGGTLLTGGAMKDLTKWAQDYADTKYNEVYGRAKDQYGTAFSTFENNQNKQFQRLMALSGQGQSAAAGQAAAAGDFGNDGSDLITGAGNAGAAGVVGAGNAWGSGLAGAGMSIADAALMKYWQNQGLAPNTGSSYVRNDVNNVESRIFGR
ncbi:hypothetical protein LLG88_13670 [bacterium]|nr:hypothetical protein [bacterium]